MVQHGIRIAEVAVRFRPGPRQNALRFQPTFSSGKVVLTLRDFSFIPRIRSLHFAAQCLDLKSAQLAPLELRMLGSRDSAARLREGLSKLVDELSRQFSCSALLLTEQ